MDLGIKNKIALVTGSSRGIGKAAAISLAKEGAKVVICGRNQITLDTTLTEIKKINHNSNRRSSNWIWSYLGLYGGNRVAQNR